MNIRADCCTQTTYSFYSMSIQWKFIANILIVGDERYKNTLTPKLLCFNNNYICECNFIGQLH